jgi:polyisoprenyl-phosphate glycosyltransferase
MAHSENPTRPSGINSPRTAKLCSIVIPVCNEELNLKLLHDALKAGIQTLDCDCEFVFVDDGSTDDSVGVLTALRARDSRIKVVRFTRNFGSHPALSAGLAYAQGEVVVFLTADLQDPPALIPKLYERWQQGYEIVWATPRTRNDPMTKKLLAKAFYKVFERVGLRNFRGSGFALLDRKVVDVLGAFKELNRAISPLVLWTGFPCTEVSYDRQARHAGTSKFSLARQVKMAIDLTVSYSHSPIRLISYLGIFVSILSFAIAVFVALGRLVFGFGSLGWPSVIVSVFFIGGVQLVMLGILGEYLWRMLDEVRKRPLYIVMEEIGVTKKADEDLPNNLGRSRSAQF